MEHLRTALGREMADGNWPVTFSIGMVSFETVPDSLETIVRTADNLMYEVKRASKNAVYHRVWRPADDGSAQTPGKVPLD